jgi:DNA-binding MarR family transcriptional regulator
MRAGNGTITMHHARYQVPWPEGDRPHAARTAVAIGRRHPTTLEPIRVTLLQAGVLLFLRRHAEANVTDAAATLGVRLPTVSVVVKALVRKRWVTKRRSGKDDRVVVLSLSRWGDTLALQIENRIYQVNATLAKQDPRILGMISKDSRA